MTDYSISDAIGGTASTVADTDVSGVTLGTEFYVTSACWLTHIRWWQATTGSPSSADRSLGVYRVDDGSSGTLMSGWHTSTPVGIGAQDFTLPIPLSLVINQRYRVCAFHPAGKYVANSGVFSGSDFVSGPLVVPNASNAIGNDQGSYAYAGSPSYPIDTFGQTFYWTGAIVTDVDPAAISTAKLVDELGYPIVTENGDFIIV